MSPGRIDGDGGVLRRGMPELILPPPSPDRLTVLELTVQSLVNTQRLSLLVSLGMLGLAAYAAFRPPPPPRIDMFAFDAEE